MMLDWNAYRGRFLSRQGTSLNGLLARSEIATGDRQTREQRKTSRQSRDASVSCILRFPAAPEYPAEAGHFRAKAKNIGVSMT